MPTDLQTVHKAKTVAAPTLLGERERKVEIVAEPFERTHTHIECRVQVGLNTTPRPCAHKCTVFVTSLYAGEVADGERD
jgi:hypothetical protein